MKNWQKLEARSLRPGRHRGCHENPRCLSGRERSLQWEYFGVLQEKTEVMALGLFSSGFQVEERGKESRLWGELSKREKRPQYGTLRATA